MGSPNFDATELRAIQSYFSYKLDVDDMASIVLVEEDGESLALPTGRTVYLPEELLQKDHLASFSGY